MPEDISVKQEIEKEKHHVVHKAIQFEPLHPKHEEYKKAPKKHMQAHLALWIIALIISVMFIASAMIYLFSLLK